MATFTLSHGTGKVKRVACNAPSIKALATLCRKRVMLPEGLPADVSAALELSQLVAEQVADDCFKLSRPSSDHRAYVSSMRNDRHHNGRAFSQ